MVVFFCRGIDPCCASDFESVSKLFFFSASISVDHGVVVLGVVSFGRGGHVVPTRWGGMSGGLGGGLGEGLCGRLGRREGRECGEGGSGVFR